MTSQGTSCFFKNAAKNQFEEEKQLFLFKMVHPYAQTLFSFWQNVVFTYETMVRISSDGIVRVFRRNETRFFEKTQKV